MRRPRSPARTVAIIRSCMRARIFPPACARSPVAKEFPWSMIRSEGDIRGLTEMPAPWLMASFGEASGDPDPMPPRRLGALGSIYLTHPSLSNYTVSRAELLAAANDLFAMVASGTIRIEISKVYALKDAPQAHADIEARKTTGSIVLVV